MASRLQFVWAAVYALTAIPTGYSKNISSSEALFSEALFSGAFGLTAPSALADFMLGDASNFAVLFEGNTGKTLNFNNSNISGNIGVGNNGFFASAGGCAGNCLITGAVEFSAPNTGQFSSNNTTIIGGVLYNQPNVQTDLTSLNTLSQNLGSEPGTSLTITGGGSVNASSGTLDANGNFVFTLSNASNFPNGTFTINGTSSQFVVVNVPMSFSFNGSIVLAGGITSDQVLFNFTGGNYSTLSGGDTLTISTNGATTSGTFLDPNGNIQINHSVLHGRLFGGDSQNMQIVSGVEIDAPPSNVPEPLSSFLVGGGLIVLGAGIRRLRPPASR